MIDETVGKIPVKKVGVRTRVMDSLTLNVLGMLPRSPVRRISELGSVLRFIMSGSLSSKGSRIMNVQEMVDKWIGAIVGMCLAHDKDSYDAHDAKADELLTPLLKAPVAQIREFYYAMIAKMQKDPRVPFLVQISFEAWGEVVVKNAPDEKIKRLKRKLAAEITALVAQPAKDQLPEAIRRALCWRDEETLQEVKAALKSGAKPKMVGRQSCLFLEMQHKKKKVSVML